MLEDWGLDDSRSWRPGYLSLGKRAWEIQASARGKGRRSRRARVPSGDAVAGARGGDLGERARHRPMQWREKAGGIQASARHRREGAAAHGIRVKGARRWSFLPNGVFVVSRSIGASVDVVSY